LVLLKNSKKDLVDLLHGLTNQWSFNNNSKPVQHSLKSEPHINAEHLGFESSKIITLKESSRAIDARSSSGNSKPLLITDCAGVEKLRRCAVPSVKEDVEDRESLTINHLRDVGEEQETDNWWKYYGVSVLGLRQPGVWGSID